MELFRDTHFDFLGRKWWFILPSLVLTLAGLVSLVARGGPLYSIDFKGGAQMEVRWEGSPPIERVPAAGRPMATDLLITCGLFYLLKQNTSLPVLAALLTLVVYSMNDPIVLFDRIRENRRARGREPLAETINRSINQTLSRTILTSGL